LKPDQTAIFFSQDGWHRGLVLTEKCWYVVDYEPDTQVWRIVYTDRWYDFNVAYSGSPADLAIAIRALLNGDDAIVKCRVKPKEPALQRVSYSMKRIHEKRLIAPATAPAADQP
jgi:hypothetical protein